MKDISTYLKNDTVYSELDRSITTAREALNTASDPVKPDLRQEIQLREKAQKKFKDLWEKANELGYGSTDINSEEYGKVLKAYLNLVKDGNPNVNEDELYKSIQEQGKQKGPVNKKALGLGIGLGCASAYTLASGIVGLAGGGDLTALFVTEAIPAIASAVGKVASFMWGISPTFALGSLAVTALAVPLVKMAVQKAWQAHKVNKAKKEAVVRAQNEDAHKKAVEGRQNRQNKINHHKATAETQFIYGDEDISKANDLNSPTTTDSLGDQIQDPDLQKLFGAEDITLIQAKALVARNGTDPIDKVLVAYNKKKAADTLKEYAGLLDPTVDDGKGGKKSKLDKTMLTDPNGNTKQVSLTSLLADVDTELKKQPRVKADIAKAIRAAQEAVMNTSMPPADRKQLLTFIANYETIFDAKETIGYDSTKTIENQAQDMDQNLATATKNLGLEEYVAGAVNIGDQERNKRVIDILERAQQLEQAERDNLRSEYIARQGQMGA